jgi:hypothetical protein
MKRSMLQKVCRNLPQNVFRSNLLKPIVHLLTTFCKVDRFIIINIYCSAVKWPSLAEILAQFSYESWYK